MEDSKKTASCPSDVEAQVAELEQAHVMMSLVGFALSAEPEEQLVKSLVGEDLWHELPYGGARRECVWGADRLNRWQLKARINSPADETTCLREEWFRSLAGATVPLAPPWESVYREAGNRLFTDSTREVRAAFRAHGLEFEKKNREPDDHIGLMLSFLAVLAGREAEAVEAGDEETARSLQKDQADFIDNHVLTFVDEWAAAMAEKSDSDFYAGMALLACGLVKERRAQLEEVLRGSDAAGVASAADGECCKEAVSCAC